LTVVGEFIVSLRVMKQVERAAMAATH
jgi:hypothetical protein